MIQLKEVTKTVRSGTENLTILSDVSLDVPEGQFVALTGASGSGKSTLGRCILRLIEPDEGVVLFDGIQVRDGSIAALRRLLRRMQIVFQDTYSSLNPPKD